MINWLSAKGKFESFRLLFRLEAFDSSTPDGRSKERYRRVALTAIASAAAKGLKILTTLISVPLTIRYLGTERYGLWMTISSFIAILKFADLGLGNGLLNGISEANGKDDRKLALEYVSSAFFSLSGIAICLSLIFSLIYPLVSWQKVFNVFTDQAVAEVGPAVAVFIGCFVLNIPLGITTRIQMGYQEGFQNNIWQGVGSLLGLGSVLLVIFFRKGLPWLILAMAGAPVVATLLNSIILFGWRRPWLRPNIHNLTLKASKKLYHLGVLFFVLQFAAAVTFSSDNIFISHLFGLDAVSRYAIVMRLFSILPMLLSMILAPMWPSYGESIARGDVEWVRKALFRSLKMSFTLSILVSSFLVLAGNRIISLWVGQKMTESFLLLLGLGVWTVLLCVGTTTAMFLNGSNVIRFQVICTLLMMGSALIGKVALAKTIGLPGIIWATNIAYIIFVVIPYWFTIPTLLENLKTRHQGAS